MQSKELIDPPCPELPRDLARLRKLAQRMDNAYRLPVLGLRVGYDSILGLVPVVGDVLTMLPAAYIIKESHRLGASRRALARMAVNVGVDTAAGMVPLLGDFFDATWNANIRNVNLLHRDLARQGIGFETEETLKEKGRASQ
ncbi:MAG: DUF4112 domain-containing protein [Sulfitobacter sp.]